MGVCCRVQEGREELFKLGSAVFSKSMTGYSGKIGAVNVPVESFVCQIMRAWEDEHERVGLSLCCFVRLRY